MLSSTQTRNTRRRNRVAGRKPIRDRLIKAMKMYLESNATSKQIAKRFSVSPSTLTVWAKNLGVALRSRGRRRRDEPTSLQKQILGQAWHHTYETVAQRHGMKKQSIGRLVKHWWTWAEHEFGPRRILQSRKAESVGTLGWTAQKRQVRSGVISFRLTAQQTDRVREVVRTWAFGNRLSIGVACRAVLLAAVGLGKFELPGFRGTPPPNCSGMNVMAKCPGGKTKHLLKVAGPGRRAQLD